jgi:hypothetical protein
MTLSPAEKQTLIGPLVVGCLLGAFCAYAVFASEYKLQNGDFIDGWLTAAEAVVAFLVAVVSTVGLLGVLPIAVHIWRAKSGGNVQHGLSAAGGVLGVYKHCSAADKR